MPFWAVLVAIGRLGTIWIKNYKIRQYFMTLVTIAFLGYYSDLEKKKKEKYPEKYKEKKRYIKF